MSSRICLYSVGLSVAEFLAVRGEAHATSLRTAALNAARAGWRRR